MYEGKFGNREWEQQRGTEEDQCYRTNEYCMLEEINWRSDEDIDEEALNILLRKYYQMWLENGITRTFTSEELNQYPIEKEKLNLMLMYNVCVETLGKFFSKTVNIQKYPEYFIKYYELKNLFAMLGTVKPEYEKKYGFSYDNYGEYAKDVEKDVIATIKQIGNPIDYKKVKSGRYVKPVDNKSVQKEGTDTTRPANNINQKTEYIENPNAADKNGVTLLMRAAKAGNDWDVNLLLKNGADVNLRDKDGWTALMYAVRYQNNLNILNMLIENAAYIRVRNKFNATPLLMAADYSQNPEIISVLLKNRSVSEDEGFRAFIFAITGNSSSDHIREAKIKLFLDMGIPLNRLWKGQTPLMYAAQYGKSTLVLKQLIDAGANPALQDENGNTAFEYAKANKNLAHDDIYWSLNGAN